MDIKVAGIEIVNCNLVFVYCINSGLVKYKPINAVCDDMYESHVDIRVKLLTLNKILRKIYSALMPKVKDLILSELQKKSEHDKF